MAGEDRRPNASNIWMRRMSIKNATALQGGIQMGETPNNVSKELKY